MGSPEVFLIERVLKLIAVNFRGLGLFFFFLFCPPVCLLSEGAIKGSSEDLLI